MQITIDKESGFCFGVRRAIQTIETELAQTPTLHCVGDIVHNEMEIERLRQNGLVIIDSSQLPQMHNTTVLFRAHGEPPTSYRYVDKNNLKLIDATCPVVLRLQQRIKTAWESMRLQGGQVVLFGKKGHAEVIGLMGQTDNECILVENAGQIDDGRIIYDAIRPIEIFAQTTKDPQQFKHLVSEIRKRAAFATTKNDSGELIQQQVKAHDTICRQMAGRAERLKDFATEHDLMIFVGGAKSSNSKVLFEICLNINPHSYFVACIDDLRKEWFACKPQNVGIFGATSTPMWLMENVRDAIINICN